MAEISSHARGPNDIVQGQLGDQWTLLEQQRHGLPNPPCSSKDRHLSMTLQRRDGDEELHVCVEYCTGTVLLLCASPVQKLRSFVQP